MKFYYYNAPQTTVVGLLQGFTCYSSLIAGTVHPAALFRCLSWTPSSVRVQSPAEGQMVSFLPLGPSLSRVALFPPTACFLEVFRALVMLCEWNIYYLYISNERVMDHRVWSLTCFGKPVKSRLLVRSADVVEVFPVCYTVCHQYRLQALLLHFPAQIELITRVSTLFI